MEKKKRNWIGLCFAILAGLVFFYFIAGELLLPSDRPKMRYTCDEYRGTWERVGEGGERSAMTVPGVCQAERDEKVVVETVLPKQLAQDTYLCFRSAHQDMQFYVDGVLRQQYSTRETRLFGNASAVVYLFLEMKPEDAGKTLRVETQTDSSYTGIFYTVYSGSQMGIWVHFYRQWGLELVVAFVTLILSVVVICGSLALKLCYRNKVPLEYLGWGILIAAVWLVTNSTFRQLIFPNMSAVNDMTFLMIMLLALPYLLYMDAIQKERYHKGYLALECIVTVNFVVCSLLHMTGICDFTDTIGYVACFCVISILWLIVTLFLDIKRKRVREYLFVAVGMFCVCIAAFIQIILYFQRENSFNGVILAVGLIFLLVFSTVNTIYEIVGMDREKQQALTASAAKGKFLANMSHEIRTPIHAVLGMDEMILRESRDPQIRGYAMDIQNAGQTLLALINDILDVSKIESGKLEIIPVDYDFSSLVHDVVNMMEMKARDKELAFHLSVQEDLPSRMYGDDVRLRQILVNLLTNAIKYTQEGSVSLQITGQEEADGVLLQVSVADTGIGIREEDREKLFAEFERIEEARNRNIEGTGLGMSICVQLLHMMGSKLQVQSTYGEGSVFSFDLWQKRMSKEPIGDLQARIRGQQQRDAYAVSFTAPDARLLIVDDNAVNRKVLANLLKATGVKIDEAAGGAQCLDLVGETKYDIIFMDHMMPEMDGIETLHRMQQWGDYINSKTPVVALTANAVTGAREMYLAEGFHCFLSKPVNPEKLEKLIMELLPQEKIKAAKVPGESRPDMQVQTAENAGLPDIEGIDWAYARLHCQDETMLRATVEQVYTLMEAEAGKLEKQYLAIQEAEEEKDRDKAQSAYRIQVHAMKSTAACIGAVSLFGIARMLEYAARDAQTEVLLAITPHFLAEWRMLRTNLAGIVGEPEKKQPFDSVACRQLLCCLPGAVEDMDIDMADGALAQLQQYHYPDAQMETMLAALGVAVTELAAEETEQCSRQLIERIEAWEKGE